MPRGNLEGVAPRALVLAAIAQSLVAHEYRDAWALAMTQRVGGETHVMSGGAERDVTSVATSCQLSGHSSMSVGLECSGLVVGAMARRGSTPAAARAPHLATLSHTRPLTLL